MNQKQIDTTMAICFVIMIASFFFDKTEFIRVVLDIALFIGWSLCSYYNPVRLTPYSELETTMEKLDKTAVHCLPVLGGVGAIMSVMAWW